MQALLIKLLISGVGSGLLIAILSRFLPDALVKGAGLKFGKLVTFVGGKHLGKKTWEKLEDFLERGFGVFLAGIKEGLDADDDPETPPEKK